MNIKKKGVYGAALVNKKWLWTYYIYGKNTKAHFTNKGVRAVDLLRGELENVPLCVFTMKEKDYVMLMMSTYGTNK